MKYFLIVTAAIEAGTGAALVVRPSAIVTLLLGSPLDTRQAVALGRVAGAALLALGAACWLARTSAQGPVAGGLVVAMLFYNIATVSILAFARIGSGLAGVDLWPAILLHASMAVWCIRCTILFRSKNS